MAGDILNVFDFQSAEVKMCRVVWNTYLNVGGLKTLGEPSGRLSGFARFGVQETPCMFYLRSPSVMRSWRAWRYPPLLYTINTPLQCLDMKESIF